MSLDKLNAKRHLLIAQRDQLNANLNATIGAIAIVDELIGEELADMARAKAADEELTKAATEIAERRVSEAAEAMPDLERRLDTPVEMLSVQSFVACPTCILPEDCSERGQCG